MPYGNYGAYDQSYLTPFGNLYYEATRIAPKKIYGVGRYNAMILPKDIKPVKIEPDKFKVYEKEGFSVEKSKDFSRKQISEDEDILKEPTYDIFGMQFSMESLLILVVMIVFILIAVIIRISNYNSRNYSMDLSKLLSGANKPEELKVIILSQ